MLSDITSYAVTTIGYM